MTLGDEESCDAAVRLLAGLNAAYALHKHAHWTARGPQSYSDHIMFERVYSKIDGHIDSLAERMTVEFGDDALDPALMAKMTHDMVCQMTSMTTQVLERSLHAELYVVECIEDICACLQESGCLTSGWQDLLGAIASDHETSVYLLTRQSATSCM